MILYHFTCQDSAVRIVRDGMLRPNKFTGLLWLTDLEVADRAALGLTSHSLPCDRTAARFEVSDTQDCHPWGRLRSQFPKRIVDELEDAPGRQPAHWYVAAVPLRFTSMLAPTSTATSVRPGLFAQHRGGGV